MVGREEGTVQVIQGRLDSAGLQFGGAPAANRQERAGRRRMIMLGNRAPSADDLGRELGI